MKTLVKIAFLSAFFPLPSAFFPVSARCRFSAARASPQLPHTPAPHPPARTASCQTGLSSLHLKSAYPGYFSAKISAILPPSLNPSKMIRLSPRRSRNPFKPSANRSKVNVPQPRGDLPCPRVSTAITRYFDSKKDIWFTK